jgi:hypothetical protein
MEKFHKSVRFFDLDLLMKERFAFIDDSVLRENIAINMQYIIFLSSLSEKYVLPGATIYSVYKTIIIFTASIIEAMLSYKLNLMIEQGLVSREKLFGFEESYSLEPKFIPISDTEMICGIKKTKKLKIKKRGHIDFFELNRMAKKANLLDGDLFKHSEEIREARNRIHSYSLVEVDDRYEKADIDELFSKARLIIEAIESF